MGILPYPGIFLFRQTCIGITDFFCENGDVIQKFRFFHGTGVNIVKQSLNIIDPKNPNFRLLFNEDGTPTARTGKILAATPMGRFGESEELEGGLLFLLNNEAAGFITGVVLPIDGGFSAYSGV